MMQIKQKFTAGITSGLSRGWSGYLWLLKILIPISFGTFILIWSGWLYRLDFLIQPAMGILSLPGEAALPLIIGILTGIYGAIAAMAAMDLSVAHYTLIAIFLLISHNLIQESIIQGQSGLNPFFAAFFRLTVSFIVTFTAAVFLDPGGQEISGSATLDLARNSAGFMVMFTSWLRDMAGLCIQIFAIIMPLMMVLELMKIFDLIRHIVKAIHPVLALLGLSRATGLLWLTAAVFGLSYGAAVIVEETRTQSFSRDELTRLHLSIGINHAMVEDPALFLPLGISPFWLWIPRFAAAVIVIYLFHFLNFFRRINAKRAVHKKFCNNR